MENVNEDIPGTRLNTDNFFFVARRINRRKRSLTIYRLIFIDEIVSEILVAVCLGLNDAYACC